MKEIELSACEYRNKEMLKNQLDGITNFMTFDEVIRELEIAKLGDTKDINALCWILQNLI